MTAGGDLKSSLEEAIAGGVEPWLPGFGLPLALAKWEQLQTLADIAQSTYGTARIRASDAGAERDVASSVRLPAAFGRSGDLLLETLRAVPAARYADLGLDLASPELAGSSDISARVRAALETLASVPSIAASVGSVLHVLHVAVPEAPDYDVSYSDPEVPFSIFVGISKEKNGDPVADLRLAEGILHESMHLQLTLVEDTLALVADETARHFSPWQHTMRPARGILHGIYVFAVIREFMGTVGIDPSATDEARRHAQKRFATVTSEIEAAVIPLIEGPGLAEAGRQLVGSLLDEGRKRLRPA